MRKRKSKQGRLGTFPAPQLVAVSTGEFECGCGEKATIDVGPKPSVQEVYDLLRWVTRYNAQVMALIERHEKCEG